MRILILHAIFALYQHDNWGLKMEAALAVLGIQGLLGAYDNFRNHEFREGLPHKSHQRLELILHSAREAFYLI
jgi:hypothetical protein